MDNYYELKIKINPEISEIVSNICFENFECEGVILAEEKYKDLELLSTTEGTIKAFLKSDKNVEKILKENKKLLIQRGFSQEELGSWDFETIRIENQDWSKKWKEQWKVTHVSDKISVVPSWIKYEQKPDKITIILDPGSAFGTGTHPTTQLCMRAIEKYLKIDDEMADIGTGSGILAITAAKFGAASTVGIDNDNSVIDVAKENAKINGTNCKCCFECNTADKLNNKFDFITANILHNVLAEIMGDLKTLMKDNSTLILSGILDEKEDIVLDAITKHGLKLIEQTRQENWVALTVRKK